MVVIIIYLFVLDDSLTVWIKCHKRNISLFIGFFFTFLNSSFIFWSALLVVDSSVLSNLVLVPPSFSFVCHFLMQSFVFFLPFSKENYV